MAFGKDLRIAGKSLLNMNKASFCMIKGGWNKSKFTSVRLNSFLFPEEEQRIHLWQLDLIQKMVIFSSRLYIHT